MRWTIRFVVQMKSASPVIRMIAHDASVKTDTRENLAVSEEPRYNSLESSIMWH